MDPSVKQKYREALVADIFESFRHVTRENAVSWTESMVIDNYGSPEERAQARAADTDTSWTELVHDVHGWQPGGIGGFAFLDPGGARYYLPAALTRIALGMFMNVDVDLWMTRTGDEDHLFDIRWSALTRDHAACVARFCIAMELIDETPDDWRLSDWRAAFQSYWHRFRSTTPDERDQ